MSPFSGFSSTKSKSTPVPNAFFSELLTQIDDIAELKVTLKTIWLLDKQEGDLRYVIPGDFKEDEEFYNSFGKTAEESETKLKSALDSALRRGSLISVKNEEETFYFLNSPRGRAAMQSILQGNGASEVVNRPSGIPEAKRPNIFALYEQNIGPLTPILADTLQEAEKLYPEEWITEAVTIAVTKNVRNWRFIEAILRSWKEKGRDETDQRSAKKNRKRDSEGEFADYIIH